MVRSLAMTTEDKPVEMTEVALRRRRRRSVALGVALAALVVLFYAITVVKLGPGILNRPL
jgi:hypothetical protein